MKTLRIALEYKCYPVWILDTDGLIIDNDLPYDIRSNKELDEMFIKIQEMFDSCYIDTPKEFATQGFKNKEDETRFIDMLNTAKEILTKEAKRKYFVENRVNYPHSEE